MKKFKKIVGTVIILSLFGVIAVLASQHDFWSDPQVYEMSEATPTGNVYEMKPNAVDSKVAEAQKKIDEAKSLLSAEEARLLSEIKDREDRLEEIRQVRMSFTEAPSQAE